MTLNRTLFPSNFSGFHSVRSKLKGNSEKQLRRLLEIFMRFVLDGHLSFLVFLESNEKVSSNADHLTATFLRNILGEDNDLSKKFAMLPPAAKKVVAHQIKPIYYLLFLERTVACLITTRMHRQTI